MSLSIRSIVALMLMVIVSCGGKTSVAKVSGEPESTSHDRVMAWLETGQEARGIEDPVKQLVLLAEYGDELGIKHLKYQQVHHGIPVYGSQVIVHLAADSQVSGITGQLLEVPDSVRTQPVLSIQKALEVASSEACVETIDENELVYRELESGGVQLAFRVGAHKGLFYCDVFVSAIDPVVLGVVNRSPSTSTGK